MRLMIIVMFFSLIYLVSSKSNFKALTESMGQEVIEIGAPIKELPMGLEEEPSAEDDDDDDGKASLKATGNTPVTDTKKEVKKTTPLASVDKDVKDVDTTDGLNQEEDEARIEKELSEIYKDTADYKTDSSEEKDVAKEETKEVAKEATKEVVKEPPAVTVEQVAEEETSAEESDKPIVRQRNNFRFQPESTDQESVEKFRTSVDDISCNNRQKLSGSPVTPPIPETAKKNAFRTVSNGIILITAVLSYVFICT